MEITIPPIGESIQQAVVGNWLKHSGDQVARDELLVELETDKINLEITAEQDGVLEIVVEAGTTVAVGGVIGYLHPPAAAAPGSDDSASPAPEVREQPPSSTAINPAAAQLAALHGLAIDTLQGSGPRGRILLDDVQQALSTAEPEPVAADSPRTVARPGAGAFGDEEPGDQPRAVRRQPMTAIRKRIAEQLLVARQQTAMATTFNAIDMTQVQQLRQQHRQWFEQKHGVALGLMSFFVKACVVALQNHPEVNAQIDGEDIVYHDFVDMGIAVGSSRGLVVPVIRHAEELHFYEIEQAIADLAARAEQGKLSLAELQGGTFTLSNGGVYGSWLSTPLLNPPQSATLGMHRIEQCAVVRNQQVVIRPMMNVALSYDHRLIDGRQAIGFLNQVKELLETPDQLLLEI